MRSECEPLSMQIGGPEGHRNLEPSLNSTVEAARTYIDRGLAVIPVPSRAKVPSLKGWQNIKVNAGNVNDYFNGRPQNIGILLGERSGRLVDIDLDSREANLLADFFLPQTGSIFGRPGKPSSHRLYVCENAEYKKFTNPLMSASKSELDRKNACIVEIRTGTKSKGIQTIFPPSTHETGEQIQWVTNGEPTRIDFFALRQAVGKLAAAALLTKYWRPGIRHDLTLAISGALQRNGISAAETKNFIKAICIASHDEEVGDRTRVVDETLARLASGETTFGLPKLSELTDAKIVRSITEWLSIGQHGAHSKASGQTADRFTVVCLKDVVAQDVEWLWKPFIPVGEFTILEGVEGLGKSWIGCALACAVASGGKLPFDDGGPVEPANVLPLSAEDSLSHTVRPRLDSMGANLNRIFAIDEVFSLNDQKDLIRFEAEIAKYHPKLVVFDPVFSYTAGKNLNAESDSRPIARKLIALAQKYNCAIVGIRHVGKSKGQGDPRNAGLGSISWRASARSVLLVGQDSDSGERAICQTKNNLTEQSPISVGFNIVGGQFLFDGRPSGLTKEKMLAQASDPESKAEKSEAVEFLRETLSNGERPSKEIEKEAKELGITTYALRRAKPILGVESFKKGGNFGGDKQWYLRLPGPAEVVDIRKFQHLQENHSNKTSYHSDLAEDVEIDVTQQDQHGTSPSSNGFKHSQKAKATCACGSMGYLGYDCRNCGEIVSS